MAGKLYKPDTIRHMFHRFIVGEVPNEIPTEASGRVLGREARAFCPVCEDPTTSATPSANINIDLGVWGCRGKCGSGGTVGALVAQLKSERGFNTRAEMMAGRHIDPIVTLRSTKDTRPTAGADERLTEEQVLAYTKRLLGSDQRLSDLLSQRGFTVDTVRTYGLGWDGTRYTIPIYDETGALVNIRRYKMDAGAKGDKMLNLPGHGAARIYGLDILAANDSVVLAEGETDMILANQYGIPAITHTAGAATFKPAWGPLFEGKTIYICYDNDEGGKQGALKAARIIGAFTQDVYLVDLPIPVKGADITDYLYKEGKTKDDFEALLLMARPAGANVTSKHIVTGEAPTDGKETSLEESMSQVNTKEVVKMTVTVAGKQNPPYTAPRRFTVNCDMSKGAVCQACPVFARDGEMSVEFARNDKDLFRFIDVPDDKREKLLKTISGARCGDRAQFDVESVYVLEELTLGNSVDDRKVFEDQKPISRQVFSVGTHATEVNTTVKIVGTNTENPRTGRMSFMCWSNTPVRTSLDTFTMSKSDFHDLSVFRPNLGDNDSDPQSPLDKCFEIAHDLSNNVTRIYGRDLLHVAYDLVWHSPIAFEVEGRMMEKGWLEMMAIGDTRTGKSEAAITLARHYRSGIVKSCEGATFAGLVGGAQQGGGGGWMTTWGVIPLNDRRLVVLDEVSGLKDREVIENMSAIRSSGRAQLTKIDVQETSARTRLIWISNPADGSMLDDKGDVGIGALRTVVKANEDIARFDYVIACRASEVPSEVINAVNDVTVPHVYTSDVASRLVLWTWSLKPEQIKFTAAAETRARELAQQISNEYIPDPPLLQTENARFKLYRIAAAIACRTFANHWEDRDQPIVRVTKEHVDDAKRFLDLLYDSPGMQYRSRSKRVLQGRAQARDRRYNCKMYLLEHEDTVLVALKAIGDSTFKVRDFREFAGMTDDQAQAATKKLGEWKMIHRKSRGDIAMDRVLVEILREIEGDEESDR